MGAKKGGKPQKEGPGAMVPYKGGDTEDVVIGGEDKDEDMLRELKAWNKMSVQQRNDHSRRLGACFCYVNQRFVPMKRYISAALTQTGLTRLT